jgi:hypothetical protein
VDLDTLRSTGTVRKGHLIVNELSFFIAHSTLPDLPDYRLSHGLV